MRQPNRKHYTQRSRKRRCSTTFALQQLSKAAQDGTLFRSNRVNPANGMYRGRKVLDVEV